MVDIVAYCLMPNHFHFLLKQRVNNGIIKFSSNFANSYTRYFNTRNHRNGALFQGIFKAAHIENDEQLIHVNRYIHINPAVSFLIKEESLDSYPWSSLSEYLNPKLEEICSKEAVLSFFSSLNKYHNFIHDQIDYAKRLESAKHLLLE